MNIDMKTSRRLLANSFFTFVVAAAVAIMHYAMLFQLFAYAVLDRKMPSKRFILTYLLSYLLLQIAVNVTKRMFKEVTKKD